MPRWPPPSADVELAADRADDARHQLGRSALRNGSTVFAEEPAPFVARIEAYWDITNRSGPEHRATPPLHQVQREPPMTSIDQPLPAAPLPIDGLINFRDLGGVATFEGQRVQPGLVFRSDSLDRLSTLATDQLADLGIARVIDLRSDEEIAAHGRIETEGVEWIQHSIGAPPSSMDSWYESGIDPMITNYGLMTTDYASEVVNVLERIAGAPAPVVVHCTSGKDRTGVIAAVVQLTLGVPSEVIVAEYEASSGTFANTSRPWPASIRTWQRGSHPAAATNGRDRSGVAGDRAHATGRRRRPRPVACRTKRLRRTGQRPSTPPARRLSRRSRSIGGFEAPTCGLGRHRP
ncbi:MAG: tyrosine-protein phosphatase [Acidimicrobiales bacterium]